ncbi:MULTISPECIES: YIP1 family protein [Bacillus]|uniref:YIP1 family protein n=1 Tax=Bacillus TaxID=1386 RepID=UPI000DBBC232|nr:MULTISPECIES: YIP1 family protein [Bacillus]MCY7670118.1 YIP1 family protein [Bacillus altitudinis]TFW49606.1 hypothetical protein ES896_04025 [Bacillus sp. 005/A4HT-01/001]SPR91851.1 Yip1 domain protein [Bacillus altitudinis]
MLHWISVLFNPIKTFEKTQENKRAVLNIIFVFTALAILHYFSILNLTSSVHIKELDELPEDFPMSLLVIIVTAIQLIVALMSIILLTIIFKVISLFIFKGIGFKTILFIIILSQIPNALSALLNSFFVNSIGDGMLLSLFGLGYAISNYTNNVVVLNFLNSIEIFKIWAAFITATGFYVYTKKYSLTKTCVIIIMINVVINTLTGVFM